MLTKVLAAEGDLSSPSNVNTATVVRLYNSHSGALVITRKTAAGVTIGSFTAVNGQVINTDNYTYSSPRITFTGNTNNTGVLESGGAPKTGATVVVTQTTKAEKYGQYLSLIHI